MSLFASPLKSPAKQPTTSAATATPRKIPAPLFTADPSDVNPFAPPSSSTLPEAELYSYAPIEEEPPEEDAQVLLAKMKQTVESVKRRQSLGRPSLGPGVGVVPTPRKASANGFSLLAPDAGSTPIRRIAVSGSQESEVVEDSEEERENEDAAQEDAGMDVDDAQDYADQENIIPTQPVDAPTPSFKGVRELFSAHPPMATPRMDGVRELFRTERVQATPAFDGLGEMLETPAGWETQEEVPPETSDPSVVEVEQPTKPAPKTLARRVPATRVPTATGPALARGAVKRPTPRMVPGGLRITPIDKTDPAASTSSTGSTGKESEASTSKSALPRRATTTTGARVTARKVKAPVVEPEPEPEVEVETQVHEVDMEDAEPEAPKPVRRTTRKTSASPAPEQPVRRSTRKTPTPQPEEIPAGKVASSSRRRAKTPTLPGVEEEEDVAEKPGAKVRKTARGKLTMEVKEEDEDESALSSQPPARAAATVGRATRGRKPAGSATTASSLPRSTSTSRVRAPTASSTKKSAAGTATKTKGASDRPGDKENTPERQTALEDDTHPATTTQRSATRGKTATAARSGGRARAGSVDVDTTDKVAAGAKVSRARARK